MLEDKLTKEGFKLINSVMNRREIYLPLYTNPQFHNIDFRFVDGSKIQRGRATFVYARGNSKKANSLVNRLAREYDNYITNLGRYSKEQ